MKPWLQWALAGSVLASTATMFMPDPAAQDAAAGLLPDRVLAPQAARPTAAVAPTRWPAPWPLAEPAALAAWASLPDEMAAHPRATPAPGQPTPRPAAAAATAAAAPASAVTPPGPPAFPYRWIGRLQDGNGAQAFLANAQSTLNVRAGDLIDQRWRVERVGDTQLEVVWLATGDLIQVLQS